MPNKSLVFMNLSSEMSYVFSWNERINKKDSNVKITVIYKRVNLQIKTEKIPLQVLIILHEKLQIKRESVIKQKWMDG